MALRCLLDLDGVLVDFVKAVESKYGIKVNEWDFDGKIPGVTKEEFWKSCDAVFWATLQWTNDGKEIIRIVENFFGRDNVCLLTSPCRTYGCMEGKHNWIENNLPEYSRRFLMGPAKRFCASPDSVLIDDSDKNVDEFRKAGGHTILVPRPWNELGYLLEPASPPLMSTYHVKESLIDLFRR